MIITFCGHAQYEPTDQDEQKLIAILEETIGEQKVEFYLGGYGKFDHFAYRCCKKYKMQHPNVSLVYITPYLTVSYQKNHLEYQKAKFDSIIYPNLERKPLRFAISYRNQYMIDCADFVIAYISRDWGGAYKTYRYAKHQGKTIFNLGSFIE